MTQATDVYPQPERFIPERYLGLDPEVADQIDPRKIVFGFGRRWVPRNVPRTTRSMIAWVQAVSRTRLRRIKYMASGR